MKMRSNKFVAVFNFAWLNESKKVIKSISKVIFISVNGNLEDLEHRLAITVCISNDFNVLPLKTTLF